MTSPLIELIMYCDLGGDGPWLEMQLVLQRSLQRESRLLATKFH